MHWHTGAALLAAAAMACGGSGAARDPSGDPQSGATLRKIAVPGEGSLYHGVFPAADKPQGESDVSQQALDGYEQAAGRQVAWVYLDNEWFVSRAFPVQTATWVRARGAVPFIRLMMRSQKEPLVVDPVFTLDRILTGEFDPDLAAWADAARRFATPLVVEYGTEVNGDWNPWSAPYTGGYDVGPAKFKAAWRHIVELMRSRGANNITWALHYNGENFPGDEPRNVPAAYYPGDDVVDWVGISVYGSERASDHRCPTFRALVDAMAPQLRAATSVKPLFIFELGITNNNPGCAAGPWVKAAFDDLLGGRWPDVRGFSWWQQRIPDRSGGFSSDMLIQDDPAVTAAFRNALTGPGAGQIVDRPLQ